MAFLDMIKKIGKKDQPNFKIPQDSTELKGFDLPPLETENMAEPELPNFDFDSNSVPKPLPKLNNNFSFPEFEDNEEKVQTPQPQKFQIPKPVTQNSSYQSTQTRMVSQPQMPVPKFEDFDSELSRPEPEVTSRPSQIMTGKVTPFMKIDDFREILNGINIIKSDLKEANDVIEKLKRIKENKDKEYERWKNNLEDTQRKLSYIDHVLFEMKRV